MRLLRFFSITIILSSFSSFSQIVYLKFEGNANGEQGTSINGTVKGSPTYVDGLDGKAIQFSKNNTRQYINLGTPAALDFDDTDDFTVQVWVKTTIDSSESPVIMSNSDLSEAKSNVFGGIYGYQKLHDGWSLYAREGSWGFNIGDGVRNYWYEPYPGTQVLNDGEWHQLAFTHNDDENSIRVYFDGRKWAIIEISDLRQDISSNLPTCIAVDGKADNSQFDQYEGLLDEIKVWDRTLTDDEITALYAKHFTPSVPKQAARGDTLKCMAWNIWHGGTHFTIENDGFNGAYRVAEIIRELDADIIMMQETYGAGPKIASILGYDLMLAASLFSAKVWGSNISVMSRYPMKRAYEVNGIPENNGGAHIKVSEQKDIIAFSNWSYGDNTSQLEKALNHWSSLINSADNIPVFWGGDYNQDSHLGGNPSYNHSRLMANAGFKEAHYELNGYEKRIDFSYYKGKDVIPVYSDILRNSDISKYPSDHPIVYTKYVVDFPVNNTIAKKKAVKDIPVLFNPVKNTLDISLEDMGDNDISIKVFNTMGQRIINKSLQKENTKVTLPLSSSQPGMYLVRLNTSKGEQVYKVLVDR